MADQKLTDQQRRHIFAAGRERGMSTDDLRRMTPAGSISMLTRDQAASLIDALKRGKSPDYERRPRMPRGKSRSRKPEGVIRMISEAQRARIEALRIDIDCTKEELQDWLRVRHFPDGRPLTEMCSGDDAVYVIELLKHVLNRTIKGRQRNAAGDITA